MSLAGWLAGFFFHFRMAEPRCHCLNEIEVDCYLLKRTVKRHAMSRNRCIRNRFNANCEEFYVSHVQTRYTQDIHFYSSLNLIITFSMALLSTQELKPNQKVIKVQTMPIYSIH